MPTVKTEVREPETSTTTEQEAPKQEDLHVAYQIHTLAQMLYGRMAAGSPWVTHVSPHASFPPPTAWPPSMAAADPPTWFVPPGWVR